MNKNLINLLFALILMIPFMSNAQIADEHFQTKSGSDAPLYANDCPAQSVPFIEDFDSYMVDVSHSSVRPNSFPNHQMPDCWNFPIMPNLLNGGPAIWLTDYASISINNVSMRMVTSNQKPTYVALPQMAAPLSMLKISFDYINKAGSDDIRLGVMTDPSDFSSFMPLETFTASATVTTATHSFNNDHLNPRHTYYIAIDAGNHNNGTTILDNFNVSYLPTCNTPSNITARVLSANQVEVNWISSSSSYEVAYRPNAQGSWISLVVDANSVLLENLDPTTTYQVHVRALCEAGQTSSWSSTITFTTPCSAYDLPFSEDFNTINNSLRELDCWGFYHGLVDEVLSGRTTLHSNNDVWKFSRNNSINSPHAYINVYGQGRCDWMVTPAITLNSEARLSFKYSLCSFNNPNQGVDGNISDDRFIVLVSTNNGDTWQSVASWGSRPTDTHRFGSITIHPTTVEISLNQFIDQEVRIAFYAESTLSGDDNNLHIDDIRVDAVAPQCPRPYNLSETPAATRATINWEGSGQSYDITIRERGSNNWANIVNVNTNSYTFTSLTPGTEYIYRVRQVCAPGLHSNWIQSNFTTLDIYCERPVVSLQGVGSTTATIACEKMSEHKTWEINVFNETDTLFYKSFDYNCTLDDLNPLTEYRAIVRAQCTEDLYSDWSDTISFTTLDCFPVSNITISNITANSAMVRWQSDGDENAWQIDYGDLDFDAGCGTFINTTASSYAISGLQPNHVYEVYVRAKCSSRFHSIWRESVTFKTKDGPLGITDADDNINLTIYPNPTSAATTIRLQGVDGLVKINVIDINGRTLFTESLECGSDCEKRIDVAGLAQGTYFVNVIGDNINSVRKLIVR